MELKKVDIERFKQIIYPEYEKMFPEIERKSYERIVKLFNNNILEVIEIRNEEEFIGFMIINTLKNNPYAQLDYFAILPEYQRRGYGKHSLILLKELYKDYEGIFIEIEKLGLGEDDEENEIRRKRASFYESIGCVKMGFELELFQVLYSAYILPCSKEKFLDEEVIKKIYEIYEATAGKERTRKNCRVLN